MKLTIFILLLIVSLKIASSQNMISLGDSTVLAFEGENSFTNEETLISTLSNQNNTDHFQNGIIITTPESNQLFVTVNFDLQLNKSTFIIYNIFGKAVLKGWINEHTFTTDTTNRTIMFSRKFMKR